MDPMPDPTPADECLPTIDPVGPPCLDTDGPTDTVITPTPTPVVDCDGVTTMVPVIGAVTIAGVVTTKQCASGTRQVETLQVCGTQNKVIAVIDVPVTGVPTIAYFDATTGAAWTGDPDSELCAPTEALPPLEETQHCREVIEAGPWGNIGDTLTVTRWFERQANGTISLVATSVFNETTGQPIDVAYNSDILDAARPCEDEEPAPEWTPLHLGTRCYFGRKVDLFAAVQCDGNVCYSAHEVTGEPIDPFNASALTDCPAETVAVDLTPVVDALAECLTVGNCVDPLTGDPIPVTVTIDPTTCVAVSNCADPVTGDPVPITVDLAPIVDVLAGCLTVGNCVDPLTGDPVPVEVVLTTDANGCIEVAQCTDASGNPIAFEVVNKIDPATGDPIPVTVKLPDGECMPVSQCVDPATGDPVPFKVELVNPDKSVDINVTVENPTDPATGDPIPLTVTLPDGECMPVTNCLDAGGNPDPLKVEVVNPVFDNLIKCDPNNGNATVIVVVTYDSAGVPSTSYYNLAGTPWTGDPATLADCAGSAPTVSVEAQEFCDNAATPFLRWFVTEGGLVSGSFDTDLAGGSYTPVGPVTQGNCATSTVLENILDTLQGCLTVGNCVDPITGDPAPIEVALDPANVAAAFADTCLTVSNCVDPVTGDPAPIEVALDPANVAAAFADTCLTVGNCIDPVTGNPAPIKVEVVNTAVEFDHVTACDPVTGARVLLVTTYSPTGVPTTNAFDTAGAPWTGDKAGLGDCPSVQPTVNIISEPYCDGTASTFLRWFIVEGGSVTGQFDTTLDAVPYAAVAPVSAGACTTYQAVSVEQRCFKVTYADGSFDTQMYSAALNSAGQITALTDLDGAQTVLGQTTDGSPLATDLAFWQSLDLGITAVEATICDCDCCGEEVEPAVNASTIEQCFEFAMADGTTRIDHFAVTFVDGRAVMVADARGVLVTGAIDGSPLTLDDAFWQSRDSDIDAAKPACCCGDVQAAAPVAFDVRCWQFMLDDGTVENHMLTAGLNEMGQIVSLTDLGAGQAVIASGTTPLTLDAAWFKANVDGRIATAQPTICRC